MNPTNKPAPADGRTTQAGLYPNRPGFAPAKPVAVGGIILAGDPIEYNVGRPTVTLTVRNTGDRPIQVGSHFHLFEVNRYLEFDRDAAFGYHLNIPATTAIRFEPGDEKQVEAVPYAGKRRVIGFNGLVMGYTGDEDAPGYFPARLKALRVVREAGFKVSAPAADRQPQTETPAHAARPATAVRQPHADRSRQQPASAPNTPAHDAPGDRNNRKR